MKDNLIRIFKAGLEGKGIHIEPLNALKGLTPGKARENPGNNFHSCTEILHHIVVWQDAVIKAGKGENVDWEEIEQKYNWPTLEQISEDSFFTGLFEKFQIGLNEMSNIIDKVNLEQSVDSKNNGPDIQSILILIQHNSYHLGQIIAVRKILGSWDKTNSS